ncbi:MAG TPA: GntR family transcriptional regulator [Candidatus Acidoferrales bacterium]|nr:GntR family transcriptional regulator [Candidatus Acidoferrales bacterium]
MEIRQLYVDDASPVPVYAQLEEQVLAAIARGELGRGDRLPSVRDVAAGLGLNPNTVNRAWAELERQGAVEVRRGLGTFVAGARRAWSAPRLREIAESFVARTRALGYEPRQILDAVKTQLKKRGTS